MGGRNERSNWLDGRIGAGVGVALLFGVTSAASGAMASGEPLSLTPIVVAQAAQQPDDPGMFGRISRWFDRSATSFNDGIKEAFTGLGRLGEHTGGAVTNSAGSLTALKDMRVVEQRQRCPPAANGAPDCTRAAAAICRGKGFASGRSFETRSEEKCSMATLLARHAGQPTSCRNETYVLRSLCQ